MIDAKERTARRTHGFTESVIREMSRVARSADAINLGQGFPDFPAPDVIKEAACRAIREDVNQYAVTWGTPSLRMALAKKYQDSYGLDVDPETEITVTCGATEAMAAIMLSLVNPDDEVIVFEPFYENYGPDATLSGAKPVFLPLSAPDFRLDATELEARVTERTRAIIVNTPNNPTGRVFSREELEAIADVCRRRDLIAFTDEIYEHIYYDGEHLPLATFDGMRDRTVTISGASKTFAITGWRIGTIVAPPDLTGAIRKVHDFLTVGAPAPLQEACAHAMTVLGREYYDGLAEEYRERREVLHQALTEAGFDAVKPEGAYYIMADFSALSDMDDDTFARHLTTEGGVASVPGSSFFSDRVRGSSLVRFAFCKSLGKLEEAGERLRRYASAGS